MPEQEDLDILILHGRSLDLVQYFVDFFASLGLAASSAINLPSRKHAQEQKVTHYIESARLVVALVTSDPDSMAVTSARPNVYLELATAHLLRPSDLIVLQESQAGQVVDLGSNLSGSTVTLPYVKGELYRTLPHLLRELRQRDLIRGKWTREERPEAVNRAEPPVQVSIGTINLTITNQELTFEAGTILNEFLDEMDTIWDSHFDEAWSMIFHTSPEHESHLATLIDLFFQNYQRTFSVLTRDKKRGIELQAVANEMLNNSWNLASHAWEAAFDAKRLRLSKGREAKNRQAAIRRAIQLYSEAKQLADSKERIAAVRRAIAAFG